MMDDHYCHLWLMSLLSFPPKKYGFMFLKLMFMSLVSLMMSFQIDLPKNPANRSANWLIRLETGTADANGCCWCSSPWRRSQRVIIYQSHDGSMVLVYSWCSMDPMIPPNNVSIYTSTMDPEWEWGSSQRLQERIVFLDTARFATFGRVFASRPWKRGCKSSFGHVTNFNQKHSFAHMQHICYMFQNLSSLNPLQLNIVETFWNSLSHSEVWGCHPSGAYMYIPEFIVLSTLRYHIQNNDKTHPRLPSSNRSDHLKPY